ncbi:MAG TPA: alpha-ketoglutarate-dependent dioxygenase AlkB [Kofleriaceae bacterium]|nr:alpha-ketoglutarate-dependent dioxygenase AlkB [Kofleriaceae bacterium]
MQRQLDLFGAPRFAFDAAFATLRRDELTEGAWIDHAPGWVSGHDLLFDELERSLAWHTEKRRMYDRVVATPRLLATIAPRDVAGGIVEDMRRALSARYGEDFVRTTAALYRDGNDSVAWHGDTTARDMNTAIVATVSLGQPRKFLLRPTEGGGSISYQLGRGDLVVMGGTCQRTWRHAIPKIAHASGPRIAVMFRPVWGEDRRDDRSDY